MSVAAVMLVRDEADVIGPQIERLLTQVDHVYVADNRSTDGTSEILAAYEGDSLTVYPDGEVGYYQARKTTRLARLATDAGHDWIIPVDADERWESPGLIRDYLAGVALDVQVVRAAIVNYVPTGEDPADGNVFERIRWRQPRPQELGKVACRAHPALRIHAGNHSADYRGAPFLVTDGLSIRHYPWRSEAQYVRKIRNGEEAYRATDLHPSVGAHWRMWEGQPDDAIAAHFREWFYEPDPPGRHELVYDPAP